MLVRIGDDLSLLRSVSSDKTDAATVSGELPRPGEAYLAERLLLRKVKRLVGVAAATAEGGSFQEEEEKEGPDLEEVDMDISDEEDVEEEKKVPEKKDAPEVPEVPASAVEKDSPQSAEAKEETPISSESLVRDILLELSGDCVTSCVRRKRPVVLVILATDDPPVLFRFVKRLSEKFGPRSVAAALEPKDVAWKKAISVHKGVSQLAVFLRAMLPKKSDFQIMSFFKKKST